MISNAEPTLPERVKRAADIFSKNEVFIRRTIENSLTDKQLADDVFQDMFLSIVKRPVPKDVRNVAGYISRAAYRDTIDAARRAKTYKTQRDRYFKRNAPKLTKEETAEKKLILAEERTKLRRAIQDKLTTSHSQAITLRYFGQKSVSETARKMKVNCRTVSRYVSVGIKKLKDELAWRESEFCGK